MAKSQSKGGSHVRTLKNRLSEYKLIPKAGENTKKKSKNGKNTVDSRRQRVERMREENSNPFEKTYHKVKYEILGKNDKGQNGQPGRSKKLVLQKVKV